MNKQEPRELAAELREYVSGRRDSRRELALLRRIRALPQAMRPWLVVPLLDLNPIVTLSLIHRSQLSPADYLIILRRGLDEADASFIRVWMTATIAHLGWRKVFSELRQELAVKPHRVAMALYHVPYLYGEQALSGSLPAAAFLDEFCQLADQFFQLVELRDVEIPERYRGYCKAFCTRFAADLAELKRLRLNWR